MYMKCYPRISWNRYYNICMKAFYNKSYLNRISCNVLSSVKSWNEPLTDWVDSRPICPDKYNTTFI